MPLIILGEMALHQDRRQGFEDRKTGIVLNLGSQLAPSVLVKPAQSARAQQVAGVLHP